MTETAEKLYCTQPAVSIKIKKLEDELNTVLFERINNRLYLTEQGKIFKQYTAQILQLITTSKEHLHQYDDPNTGKIHFGASHFVGVHLLPKIIAEYKKSYPQVELSLDILPSQQLIQKLDNHQIDFVIMSDQVHFDPQHYHREPIFTDELILVVSPANPLAKQTACKLEELIHHTFLIKPNQSETRKFLFQHLDESLWQKLKLMEINSLEGIKYSVMHNLGVSIISRIAVENELNAGLLVEVKLENRLFTRGINYVYQQGKFLSPAAQTFLELLTQLA